MIVCLDRIRRSDGSLAGSIGQGPAQRSDQTSANRRTPNDNPPWRGASGCAFDRGLSRTGRAQAGLQGASARRSQGRRLHDRARSGCRPQCRALSVPAGYLLDTNLISETRKLRDDAGVTAFFAAADSAGLFLSDPDLGRIAQRRRGEAPRRYGDGCPPRGLGRRHRDNFR
jgi:hypothetical protein